MSAYSLHIGEINRQVSTAQRSEEEENQAKLEFQNPKSKNQIMGVRRQTAVNYFESSESGFRVKKRYGNYKGGTKGSGTRARGVGDVLRKKELTAARQRRNRAKKKCQRLQDIANARKLSAKEEEDLRRAELARKPTDEQPRFVDKVPELFAEDDESATPGTHYATFT